LIVTSESRAALQTLNASGYEIRAVTMESAARALGEFAPEVIIIELGEGEGSEGESIALARRLRGESATYALPLVFAWRVDERAIRNAALSIGVDDYFSLRTSSVEVAARLDALFWRVEAGRRAVASIGDRRLEIDNFMLLLDSMREDLRAGASGTLALIYATAREGGEALDKTARDKTLAQAQGFLKLNLRRADAVAFYGPTMLLVYMPRIIGRAAIGALKRLREEFLLEFPDNDLAIGLAAFPESADEVESLIEKAEAAARQARAGSTPNRVIASQAQPETSSSAVAPEPIATPDVRANDSALLGQTATPQRTFVESESAMPLPAETRTENSFNEPVREAASSNVANVADVQSVAPQISGDEAVRPHRDDEAARARQDGEAARPVPDDDAARAAAAAAHERERRASGAIMPRRLLLTVSHPSRMAQLNSLIRAAGYEARAAFDAPQALQLLQIERPDLLLLDFDLHSFNALEMLRRLRKQGGGRISLPVVLLLSSENEAACDEALELGVRAVVRVPYDPAELLESVRVAGSVE
jgi:PleD family two-component response regulator